MEIRNIQKTGGSSFTITIPKEWIIKYKLKDKDKVVLNSHKSGSLVILPYFIKKIRPRVFINVDYLSNDVILREIIAHYGIGADEILITAKELTSEQIFVIRDTVNNLIGIDIFEQTADRILIKNTFDNSKFSIIDNVNKIFKITNTMYQDVLKAIENRDKRLALNIITRDKDVNKLYLAIVRQFNLLLQNKITEEDLKVSFTELHYYENIAIQLERIADHTVKIAKMVILQSKRSQKIFNKFLKQITKKIFIYLQQAEKMFRLRDKKIAHEIVDIQRTLSKNKHISKSIIKKSSIDIIIEDSIDRIRGYIENIAEKTIDYIVITEKK